MPAIKNIQYSSATSGTVTVNDTTDDLQVVHEAASLVATLTMSFPATPMDAQRVYLTSVLGITALGITAPVGSIVNAITTLLAGNTAGYIFRAASSKWYRCQ